MKPIYKFFLMAAAFAVAACSNDEPVVPEPEPEPEPHIMLSSSLSYVSQLTKDMDFELSANISVTEPAGAQVKALTILVDGNSVHVAKYPMSEPIKIPAVFGHGAHKLGVNAMVKLGDWEAETPVITSGKFIIFNELPKVETDARLKVQVSATSSSGENYFEEYKCESNPEGRLVLPASLFDWKPASGTASNLAVGLEFEPFVSDISAGLVATVSDLQWNTTDDRVVNGSGITLQWSNPVEFKQWHGLTPTCMVKYSGSYEGIELNDSTITGWVTIVE